MAAIKQVSFSDVKQLPLDALVIGKGQVRLSEVGRDIDELAQSIRTVGLLEPIVVFPSQDQEGKYEIVTGQRRFLAHQLIEADTILAAILEHSVTEIEAKILSLTENLIRRDLNSKDLIDVCTELYQKYGTMKMVTEESGLPYNTVRKYVKFERLIPELKEVVTKEGIDVNVALRAQDAAAVTGKVDAGEALEFAREMSSMSGAQQKRIVEERHENPERPTDEVIEEAKSGGKITQLVVTLSTSILGSLKSYARSQNENQDVAAADLIERALRDEGFVDD